jgi:hypothetical protein
LFALLRNGAEGMPLPQKSWFRLEELAERWGVKVADIEDYALDERIAVSVLVADLPAEAGWWEDDCGRCFRVPSEQLILSGPQPLSRSSLLEVFRCGQSEVVGFQTSPPGSYLDIRSSAGAIIVRRNDLIITREERDRFESEHGLSDGHEPALSGAEHSTDFSRVRIAGEWHSFGPRQSAVLRRLKSASESEHPWVQGKTLLADSGAATMRLIDLFKRKPVWRQLIIADGKGCYRINPQLLTPEKRRIRMFRRFPRGTSQRARVYNIKFPLLTEVEQSRYGDRQQLLTWNGHCAPPHSITSSARTSIESGTTKRSALAALRLMTRSNRVGSSTGSSDGRAPLRIRSTTRANCLK